MKNRFVKIEPLSLENEVNFKIPDNLLSFDNIQLNTNVLKENIVEINLFKNYNLNPPLLTKPVTVNLTGIVSKFLESGQLKENPKKKYEIFELVTLEPGSYITLTEELMVVTNLPFLVFRLKYGISDRYYLFYTLSNEVYQSFKKQSKEILLKGYFNINKNMHKKCILYTKPFLEITDNENYDYRAFLNDESNLGYINSVTLLNSYQCRLSEVTGIKELAYIQPNLLHFQPYQERNLKRVLENIEFSSNIFNFSEFGGRVDYKAHTHLGIKPLLLANTGLKHINSLKEVYWLNSSYYPSSGESLTPDEDYSKVTYFTKEGYWVPSLEDLMKIGFADYLTFKTYRPDVIIPQTISDFPLTLFSMLYLIDFIGRGGKSLNIKHTTAYSLLLYILHHKKYKKDNQEEPTFDEIFNPSKLDEIFIPNYISPEEITLNLHREQTLYNRTDDKVLLFKIPIDYHFYKIQPISFVAYLEFEYELLEEKYKTNDRTMYTIIFNRALDCYIYKYRKNNNYIGIDKINDMIDSLCIINSVDKDKLLSIYSIPNKMYIQELNELIYSVNLVKNTKNNIVE